MTAAPARPCVRAHSFPLELHPERHMWRLYMPDNAALAKHYGVPARADDLAELPPSLVVTAGVESTA